MKKIRVFGDAVVTVSCVIYVRDNTQLSQKEIFRRAKKKFNGIHEYIGNGGYDKLIGVEGDEETIAADEPVEWADFMEEWE